MLVTVLLGATVMAKGGDAVAVGFNQEGVWTAATYYCSATPPGGADYKDEAAARQAAAQDLRKRAPEGIVRTELIASSDRTGHFAYARGRESGGEKDFHAVGFGASKEEAKRDAFQQLTRQGAKVRQKVIYEYFSNGSEGRRPLGGPK